MRIILYLILLLPLLLAASARAGADLEALIERGNQAFDRLQYEAALKVYEQGLEAAPTEAVLHYNKANVYYRQGKYDQALAAYQEAISNNPAPLLLKNICFNTGNSHYQLAEQQAEKSATPAELQAALAEYEQAFDMYRRSLELDRQTTIAAGRDIRKAGISARRNWAMARDGWSKTWERLLELEKKNLSLTDGIDDLLQSRAGLLPKLELVYIDTAGDDALKFNLRTLAEYHLDGRADIDHLRQLAAQESQKSRAALENHKSATPAGATDETLAELEGELDKTTGIQRAVDKTAELEEWLVDGLKRGEPLNAWQNARQQVNLLQGLHDFLAGTDLLPGIYDYISRELAAVNYLLKQKARRAATPASLDAAAARINKLGVAKLTTGAAHFGKIDQQLNDLEAELKKGEHRDGSTTAPGGPTDDRAADPAVVFFDGLAAAIQLASVDDVMAGNTAIQTELKAAADLLTAGRDIGPHLDELSAKCTAGRRRYEHINTALLPLFNQLLKEAAGLQDRLRAMIAAGRYAPADGAAFAGALALTDVLLFKYGVMLEKLAGDKTAELDSLRANLPAYHDALAAAWTNFATGSQQVDNIDKLTEFTAQTVALRAALLQNLAAFAPELAIGHYYEQLRAVMKKITAQLPATTQNRQPLLEQHDQAAAEIKRLQPLLEEYFRHLPQAAAAKVEQEKKAAADYLKQAAAAGREAAAFTTAAEFLKSDFLFTEAAALIDKSALVFAGQPTTAVQALTAAGQWQKALKQQCRAAVAIETQEGGSAALVPYTTLDQSEVIKTAEAAIAKIREIPAPVENGAPAAPTPPPDPAGLEEAVSYTREAISEAEKILAFLQAREFHNTEDKHDRVIDLLAKAVAALSDHGDKPGGDQEQPGQEPEDRPDQPQEEPPAGNGQNAGEQSPPLQLSAPEARELLNRLNNEDAGHIGAKDQGKRVINTPRPW